MLANVNLAADAELLAPRGRIVVVGSRGALEFMPRLLMGKEADRLRDDPAEHDGRRMARA